MTARFQITSSLNFTSTGLAPSCETCQRDYGYQDREAEFVLAIETEDALDEGSFSRRPCEDCRTTLGGNRYVAHGFDNDDELYHYEICTDCMLLLNGYGLEELGLEE